MSGGTGAAGAAGAAGAPPWPSPGNGHATAAATKPRRHANRRDRAIEVSIRKIPKPKAQIPSPNDVFGAVLIWSLGFGVWAFLLFLARLPGRGSAEEQA